jgi:hypothetical protein
MLSIRFILIIRFSQRWPGEKMEQLCNLVIEKTELLSIFNYAITQLPNVIDLFRPPYDYVFL